MPKPLFGDNGSGMHVHQSVWDGDKPIFGDTAAYGGLSQAGRYYVGGLLKHAPALLAFAAPTTNSYHRLVPGYEAPVNLAWSIRNRSAAVRIPMYSDSPKAKRAEFRCPDPSCNPYIAFAAMLMAGLDGIRNRIDPGDPVDKNIYDLPPEELAEIPTVPGSLAAALAALEADHEFLTEGDVFTQDFIENYLAYKREKEVDPIRLRLHPTSSCCTTTSRRGRGALPAGSTVGRLSSAAPPPRLPGSGRLSRQPPRLLPQGCSAPHLIDISAGCGCGSVLSLLKNWQYDPCTLCPTQRIASSCGACRCGLGRALFPARAM